MKGDRLFEVKHQERPTVRVRAVDRLRAISAAAREWGDRWTEIARDCEVSDLGPAPEQSGNGGLRGEQRNGGKARTVPQEQIRRMPAVIEAARCPGWEI